MRWSVLGADKSTGRDRVVSIDADTSEQAERIASERGMFVSKVRPIPGFGREEPALVIFRHVNEWISNAIVRARPIVVQTAAEVERLGRKVRYRAWPVLAKLTETVDSSVRELATAYRSLKVRNALPPKALAMAESRQGIVNTQPNIQLGSVALMIAPWIFYAIGVTGIAYNAVQLYTDPQLDRAVRQLEMTAQTDDKLRQALGAPRNYDYQNLVERRSQREAEISVAWQRIPLFLLLILIGAVLHAVRYLSKIASRVPMMTPESPSTSAPKAPPPTPSPISATKGPV